MWQLSKKTGLIVFSFIFITGIWLSEAAPQPTSDPGQKISEDIKEEVDEFFRVIINSNPYKRKEGMLKVLGTPGGFVDINKPQQYINEIRKRRWPGDEATKAKIEMVLKVLEDQNDFFNNRWEQVSSPTGNAEDTPEKFNTQSGRTMAAMCMAAQEKYEKEHWPSIIRDKKRKPLDRFYAAFYLARFYINTYYGTCSELTLVGDIPFEASEKEALVEAGHQFHWEVLRLCADKDREVSFLMQLDLAHQRYFHNVFPGRGDFVPAAIDGLDNDYLYFRLLSQEYLEQITGQKFDLDPTDPPEIRASGVEKWREWWRDNKYDLYYDPWSERLLPRRPQRRPEGQTTTQ